MTENKREITLFTNKLIKKLYKVSQPYTSHMYNDEMWENVHEFIDKLSEIEGIKEVDFGTNGYHNIMDGPYKDYRLDITTIYSTKIKGLIRCHFCGSIENPYSCYDMTVSFYKDNNLYENLRGNKIRLTENELHNIIKESVKRILKENNFKNPINKTIAAIYASGKKQGKSISDIKKDVNNYRAKIAAIADINKDRDIKSMTPHEQEFNNTINSDTFNIDFEDANDIYAYDRNLNRPQVSVGTWKDTYYDNYKFNI